jgi:polyhydroxyalkanoate synthase
VSQWLSPFVAFAAVVLATWAHIAFWRWKLQSPVSYDETHRVPLADGSWCELRRLRPAAPSKLPPVLMVHGIAINHRNLDPRDDVSLARSVRDSGRDVWLLTLRSGRWDLTRKERRAVDFAALAHNDIPQGVAMVLAKTGAPQLDYLGFSMGGMLAYASFGHTVGMHQIRRVVIMGSPGFVGAVLPGTKVAAWIGRYWQPTVPSRFLNGLFAFVAELVQSPIQHLFLNPANCLRGLLHTFMIDATADIPGRLAMNMVQWAALDGKVRLDHEPVLPRLVYLEVPVLFMVGGADQLGTPKSLTAAYDAWGGPKRLVLLAKSTGYVADYGHMDMVTGPKAVQEVFAPIIEFLAEPA